MTEFKYEFQGGPHDGGVITFDFEMRTGDLMTCDCHQASHEVIQRKGAPTLLLYSSAETSRLGGLLLQVAAT